MSLLYFSAHTQLEYTFRSDLLSKNIEKMIYYRKNMGARCKIYTYIHVYIEEDQQSTMPREAQVNS